MSAAATSVRQYRRCQLQGNVVWRRAWPGWATSVGHAGSGNVGFGNMGVGNIVW
ncbi:hypothetical protein ABLO18_16095 [Mycobacterium tuberculosis]